VKSAFQLAEIAIQSSGYKANSKQLRAKRCHFFLSAFGGQTNLELMARFPHSNSSDGFNYVRWLVLWRKQTEEWIGRRYWPEGETPSADGVLSEIELVMSFIEPEKFGPWLNRLKLTA